MQTIYVRQVVRGAKDGHGNAAKTYAAPVAVECWVFPATTDSPYADMRPDALRATANAYVPKSRPDVVWRGALVSFDGTDYAWQVVGDPMEYPPELTPPTLIDANLVVGLVRADG